MIERCFSPKKLKMVLLLGLTLVMVAIASPWTDNQPKEPFNQNANQQAPAVMAGHITFIRAITPADALTTGVDQQALVNQERLRLVGAIAPSQTQIFRGNPKTAIPLIAVATIVVMLTFILLNRTFPKLLARLATWQKARISSISDDDVKQHPFYQLFQLSIGALKLLRVAIILTVFLIYGTYVLSLLPRTARLAGLIRQDFLAELSVIGARFLDSIPGILLIILASFICFTIVRLVNSLFKALEQEKLSISGFYPEWAPITCKLINLFIIGFTLALVFPLVPGYESPAFKGVSVFLGALITFGASGAIANSLAGIQLAYTRAFQMGDIVKIDDFQGKIVDKSLLVTRICTFENQIVTVSNSQVLNNQVINYSASARDHNAPLMLHTTITLGYDAPLQDIHRALIAAAMATPHVLHEPPPFVWQTSLDDFYVSYQLNAYTEQPNLMPTIYSDLHANILQTCDTAGIEILSPHYAALRDGNQSTLSAEHLPPNFPAPGFRVYPMTSDPSS